MFKKSFIWLFFVLPAMGSAFEPVLDPNSQMVGYADLKGNGLKEKIILNGNPYNNLGGYYFKSLKVMEDVRLVYELNARDGFDDVTVEDFKVAPLRKGNKWQILILLRGSDDLESTMKIIEWDGRKYAETLSGHCRTGDVRDLEKNGNFQIILGQRNQLPHIYDYEAHLRKYVVSDQKHPNYFRNLIKEYESEMAEYKDNATWLVKLEEIIAASKLAGDVSKEEEAERQLSELGKEMGVNRHSSAQNSTEGITK